MRIASGNEVLRQDVDARTTLAMAAMGRAILQRKRWLIGAALLCFLASAIGVNLIPPRYTAETKILFENQAGSFRGDAATAQLPADDVLLGQTQLIASRDIAREVIKALDLQGKPEFDALANGQSNLTRLLVLFGIERDPARIAPEERVLTSYYERLAVASVAKARVLRIRFTSKNAALAAKAANAIADLYINLQSGTTSESAATPAGARIIARAVAPDVPSIPKKGQMIAFFTLAGSVLAAGLIAARALLFGEEPTHEMAPGSMPVQLGNEQSAFGDDDEAKRRHQRRMLAQSGHPGAVLARTPSMGEESNDRFAAVLAEMNGRHKQHGAVRVVIAGVNRQVEVLPAALQFARSLARQDRVILVDCGADPKGLDDLLMQRGEAADDVVLGLTDLLVGDTTFAEVIHRDPMSRLHIVPIGSRSLEHGSKGFDMVVDALTETYDHVLLATPARVQSRGGLPGAGGADLGLLLKAPGMAQTEVNTARAALQAAGVVDVIDFDAVAAEAAARNAA
jgi:capsular polysaccharide biosynthesis protein/Mrp family chromosome partitioning ATPase